MSTDLLRVRGNPWLVVQCDPSGGVFQGDPSARWRKRGPSGRRPESVSRKLRQAGNPCKSVAGFSVGFI